MALVVNQVIPLNNFSKLDMTFSGPRLRKRSGVEAEAEEGEGGHAEVEEEAEAEEEKEGTTDSTLPTPPRRSP